MQQRKGGQGRKVARRGMGCGGRGKGGWRREREMEKVRENTGNSAERRQRR